MISLWTDKTSDNDITIILSNVSILLQFMHLISHSGFMLDWGLAFGFDNGISVAQDPSNKRGCCDSISAARFRSLPLLSAFLKLP